MKAMRVIGIMGFLGCVTMVGTYGYINYRDTTTVAGGQVDSGQGEEQFLSVYVTNGIDKGFTASAQENGCKGCLEIANTEPQKTTNPPTVHRDTRDHDITITADFIWWKTNISGTEYALTGINDGGTSVLLGSSTGKGHIQEPHYNFAPGFRVGVGTDLAHDGWDIYANYTWLYNSTQHNSIAPGPGVGAEVLLTTATSTGDAVNFHISSASSNWRQGFNVLDLELGRNMFVSHRLALRPHFGLKGAIITEHMHFKATALNNAAFLSLDNDFLSMHRSQTVRGLGVRGGLNTVWHFVERWGIYANLAITAFWNDSHHSFVDKSSSSSRSASTNLNTEGTTQYISPVFETSIGLTYLQCFHEEDYQLQVMVGWEEQIWTDFNRFTNWRMDRSGNLSLQGLTTRIGFTF